MRKIPRTNGLYFADQNGDIHSKKRPYTKGGLIKKSINNGYYYVCISVDAKKVSKKVCRLVSMAYHPNPKNKPQVNHKDGNKLNDRPDNLEWCTAKENNDHALRTGLKKHRKPILTTDEVLRLSTMNGLQRREYATERGIHLSTIHRAINRATN